MALAPYQQEVALNTLYSTIATPGSKGNTLQPFIEVIGGTINVYGTTEKPVSAPTGMTNTTPNGLGGIEVFAAIPNYMYFSQVSGSVTKIVLNGVQAVVAT